MQDPSHLFEKLLHLFTFTYNFINLNFRRWIIGLAFGFSERAARLQGVLYFSFQNINLNRFFEVIERAFMRYKINSIVQFGVRCHDKDRQVWIGALYFAKQISTFKP